MEKQQQRKEVREEADSPDVVQEMLQWEPAKKKRGNHQDKAGKKDVGVKSESKDQQNIKGQADRCEPN